MTKKEKMLILIYTDLHGLHCELRVPQKFPWIQPVRICVSECLQGRTPSVVKRRIGAPSL